MEKEKLLEIKIRRETEKDYGTVYQLIKEAFALAEHADGNEQDLVVALRKGTAYIPELSLVAETDGKLTGYILFTKAKVGTRDVLVLAPLAVKPEYQRCGIGSRLVEEGHRIARKLGYQYCLVLGSELYYPQFGYVPAEQFGVVVPEGMPSVNFMAIKLDEEAEAFSGEVIYAKEFGI